MCGAGRAQQITIMSHAPASAARPISTLISTLDAGPFLNGMISGGRCYEPATSSIDVRLPARNSIPGIIGVISYSASQRTHEIGIRMALVAQRRGVLHLILGQGAKLALLGVGIGVVLAFLPMPLIASLLYSVSATDPLTFVRASEFDELLRWLFFNGRRCCGIPWGIVPAKPYETVTWFPARQTSPTACLPPCANRRRDCIPLWISR